MTVRWGLPGLAVVGVCCLVVGAGSMPRSSVQAAVQSHPSADTKPLDACLLSHWKVTNYTSYMASVLKRLGGWTRSGEETLHYARLRPGVGVVTVIAQHFKMTAVAQDTNLVWAVELHGDADAQWATPRKGVIHYTKVFGNLWETLTIGGKGGTSTRAGPFPNGSSHAHSCQ